MAEYKQPQTVANPNLGISTDPNTLKAGDFNKKSGTPRVSTGDPAKDDVKRDGVAQRGKGAATKGFTSRGPLA